VVDTIDHHLPKVGSKERVRDRPPINGPPADLLAVTNADTLELLHRQDSPADEGLVDERHVQIRHAFEVARDHGRVRGLDPEVELFAEPVGELAGERE
jgi:hypothetical protein